MAEVVTENRLLLKGIQMQYDAAQSMSNEMLMKAEIWCWSEAFRNNDASMLLWYLAIKIYQYNTHYKDRESASRVRSKYEYEFFNELQELKNAR